MIKKGGAGFEVHKQIYIAARTGVAPSDRAKHRDSMSPALPRNAEDLGTAAAQPFKGQHIIGHLSRVSPSGATWRVWTLPVLQRSLPTALPFHHARARPLRGLLVVNKLVEYRRGGLGSPAPHGVAISNLSTVPSSHSSFLRGEVSVRPGAGAISRSGP